eukprot:gene3230-4831_t
MREGTDPCAATAVPERRAGREREVASRAQIIGDIVRHLTDMKLEHLQKILSDGADGGVEFAEIVVRWNEQQLCPMNPADTRVKNSMHFVQKPGSVRDDFGDNAVIEHDIVGGALSAYDSDAPLQTAEARMAPTDACADDPLPGSCRSLTSTHIAPSATRVTSQTSGQRCPYRTPRRRPFDATSNWCTQMC